MKKICFWAFLCFIALSLYANYDGIDHRIEYEYSLKEVNHEPVMELTETDTYKYMTKESLQYKVFSYEETYNIELKSVTYSYDLIPILYPIVYSTYSTYQTSDAFKTDTKQHFVKIPKDPRINSVFKIKKKYLIKDFSFEPKVYLPNDESLKNVMITFKADKKYLAEPNFVFLGEPLKYSIAKTKKSVTVHFDSLNITESLPYTPFRGLNSYVYFKIFKDNQLINNAETQLYFSHYQQSINHLNQNFALFLKLCQSSIKSDTLYYAINNIESNHPNNLIKLSDSKQQSLPMKSICSLVDQLDREKTNLEKISSIYSYVRSNIRYIALEDSIHNIVPHNPISVISNGYGDCKDISYLIYSLAKAYNIDLNLALLNTKYRIDENNINPTLFNHMIALYKDSDRIYYLDATCPYYYLQEIPENFYGKNYLLLKENDFKMINFPEKSERPSMHVFFETDLDSLQNSKCNILLRDDFRIELQYNQKKMNDNEFENMLNKMLSDNIPYIKFMNISIDSRSDSLYSLSADADLSSFFINSKNNYYVRKYPFNQNIVELDKRTNDPYDFYLSYQNDIAMEIDLKNKVRIEGESFDMQFQGNLHKIEIERVQYPHLKFRNRIVRNQYSASAKQEMIDFIKNMYQKKKDMIIISKEL